MAREPKAHYENEHLGIALASSLALFSGAASAQQSRSDAQERADEYLQQTVIDPMNAQRSLSGQPVITLEEYKASLAAIRKQAADAWQAALDQKAAADKANPLVQEVNRISGPCGGYKGINDTMVPFHGKCVKAYATVGQVDPRTGGGGCDASHTRAILPDDPVGGLCLLIADTMHKRADGTYEIDQLP